MEEKIFSKLKETLGKTSLSDRTIKGKATRLAKTITSDELLTDEIVVETVEELKEIEGQLNHDVASKVREALKKTPPSNPAEPNPITPPENGDDKGELESLKNALKAINDKLEEKEKAEKFELFKSQVAKELKNSGADDALYSDYVMVKYGINEEKSVEENVKTLRTEYDKIISERTDKATPIFGGLGQARLNEDDLKKAIEADVKKYNLKT